MQVRKPIYLRRMDKIGERDWAARLQDLTICHQIQKENRITYIVGLPIGRITLSLASLEAQNLKDFSNRRMPYIIYGYCSIPFPLPKIYPGSQKRKPHENRRFMIGNMDMNMIGYFTQTPPPFERSETRLSDSNRQGKGK